MGGNIREKFGILEKLDDGQDGSFVKYEIVELALSDLSQERWLRFIMAAQHQNNSTLKSFIDIHVDVLESNLTSKTYQKLNDLFIGHLIDLDDLGLESERR